VRAAERLCVAACAALIAPKIPPHAIQRFLKSARASRPRESWQCKESDLRDLR